ncbi:MAG: 3-deoxy-manno-octulosonate cytidylyltransferase [Candidatus Omnitrophica bacterium]|nr:3-deoxy-manno-octulosonate cytidylyltransferase [Candidatus Omnitrophota bacterium]
MSHNPKTIAIIPARIGSDEVYAKVLVDIGGKPVIQHAYERAKESGVFDEILIAADHEKITRTAEGFGAKTYLTKMQHICGTDRCAEAAREVFPGAKIVVNVQADEPFINPRMLPVVIGPLINEDSWQMVTLCCRCVDEKAKEFIFNPKVVKSVKTSRALYFSRSVIPFPRSDREIRYFQHIGVYAYRMEDLQRFAEYGPSELELAEELEQLRALEMEMRVKAVETDLDYPRISIDTQEDIEKARALFNSETT